MYGLSLSAESVMIILVTTQVMWEISYHGLIFHSVM